MFSSHPAPAALHSQKPKYSTWIRARKIVLFWSLGAGTIALGLGLGSLWRPALLICLCSAPFLYIAAVISLAAWRFSSKGGDYQNRIHAILIDALAQASEVLDIGCGGGNLIIKIAKTMPGRHLGLDYWGKDWEYSRAQCERNAALEVGTGVIEFVQGSASSLPFADRSRANVVSCLTFHEVADAADRTLPLTEALRVLAPGGSFLFLDLFDDRRHFGGFDRVTAVIEAAGGRIESISRLREILPLPYPLDTRNALRSAVIIRGSKRR